jgi:predicted HAD superfamily Cof-like phosphohydrolase
MDFRISMMQEELDETKAAVKNKDPEEIVDGIIDMCVFAIGTLEVFGVDANKAWDQVLKANMSKEVGIKEGRPNPLGLPDLVKPEGWKGPTHKGNHGNITDSF